MRIAIVSVWSISQTSIGGTERFVVDLAESMVAKDNIVDVYMLSGRSHRSNGVNYIGLDLFGDSVIADEYMINDRFGEISTRKAYDAVARLFEKLIDIKKYDLVQLNSLLFLRAWRNKRRIFVYHQNFNDITTGNEKQKRLAMAMIRDEVSNPLVDFVAPSRYYTNQWSLETGKNTVCIPHAINKERLHSSQTAEQILHKYNLNKESIKILFPSRLELVQKQPQLIVEACSLLPNEIKQHVQIIFTGIDPQYAQNKRQLESLSKSLKVDAKFINFKSINEGYKIADAVAIPSSYESFGYSALESLSLGIKTFLSDIPPFHEIASGNTQAVFFNGTAKDLSNHLLEYVRSKTVGVRKTPSSRWLNRYSLSQWANSYLSLATIEIRDLYDKGKKITGEKIRKGDSVPRGRYYLTVVAWIQNSKGEFLIQKTSPIKGGQWSTTGGHPKTGEDSLSGMVTEIKEELGVKINSKDLRLFKTIRTNDDFVDLYYIKVDIPLDTIRLQVEEVDSVKWVTGRDIEDMIANNRMMPSHVGFYNLCMDYLNGK